MSPPVDIGTSFMYVVSAIMEIQRKMFTSKPDFRRKLII